MDRIGSPQLSFTLFWMLYTALYIVHLTCYSHIQ